MNDLKWLNKIDSTLIKNKSRNFIGFEDELQEMKNLVSLLRDKKKNLSEQCQFFDISGKILLYGDPGTGKSSLAFKLADDLLDSKDEIESYYLPVEKIITSELGKTTENISKAFDEVLELAKKRFIIIILDEIDRFTIDRTDKHELSELKRMFDKILDFLDSLDNKSNFLLIGITNIKNSFDEAFLRRFTIVKEIAVDTVILERFIVKCNSLLHLTMSEDDIKCLINRHSIKTCGQVKQLYRSVLLRKNYTQWFNIKAEEIKECVIL